MEDSPRYFKLLAEHDPEIKKRVSELEMKPSLELSLPPKALGLIPFIYQADRVVVICQSYKVLKLYSNSHRQLMNETGHNFILPDVWFPYKDGNLLLIRYRDWLNQYNIQEDLVIAIIKNKKHRKTIMNKVAVIPNTKLVFVTIV